MDGRVSDHCITCPFSKRGDRDNFSNCLCSNVHSSVLFSDHHSGHRSMVSSQACEGPRHVQVMAELLTPIANHSAPRLAEALLKRFGSLSLALTASRRQLQQLGAEFTDVIELILAARNLFDAAQKEQLTRAPVDPANAQLLHYVRSRIGSRRKEALIVIFCDGDQTYLHDEEVEIGSTTKLALNIPRLFRRALELEASKMLLAHNHPSGICRPSRQDIAATRQLSRAAEVVGFEIVDHLIVTQSRTYSMRADKHI